MTEQVYSSRRERRLAEQGLASMPASQTAGDAQIGASEAPAAPQASLPSRRELRLQDSGMASGAQQTETLIPTQTPEFEPLVAVVDLPAVESAPEAQAVSESALENGPLFDISPSMSHEPQTNSIVIQNVNEISEISGVITDTGQFLRTGSIELPKLTQTGEIATVLESPAVDAAIHQDGFDSFVSSIAPVRATGVINSQTKVGIMPIKNKRGQGQYLFAITTSLLMLSVGALFVIAYMLGVFDK